MPYAVLLRAHGGPEVLSYEPEVVGPPADGAMSVRHTAIGVNFIDTYMRTGLYPVTLPACLGREAAGVVTAVGKHVRGFKVGDRVAYLSGSPGAYREVRNVGADRAFKLPPQISDQAAAAMMLK